LTFFLGSMLISWCISLALTTKYYLADSTSCGVSSETAAQSGLDQPECIYKLAIRSPANAVQGKKPRVVTILLHTKVIVGAFVIIGFVFASYLLLFWFVAFSTKTK